MRAIVVPQHGEGRTLYCVANKEAAPQFQPSIIATFATDQDGVMASGKAFALCRAINKSVDEEPNFKQ